MPRAEVSGGTWGSPGTLCHRPGARRGAGGAHPRVPLPQLRAPMLSLWLSGTQHWHHGGKGRAGLGKHAGFAQLPSLLPRGRAYKRACNAQEEDRSHGPEQRLPPPSPPSPSISSGLCSCLAALLQKPPCARAQQGRMQRSKGSALLHLNCGPCPHRAPAPGRLVHRG